MTDDKKSKLKSKIHGPNSSLTFEVTQTTKQPPKHRENHKIVIVLDRILHALDAFLGPSISLSEWTGGPLALKPTEILL